MTTNWTPLKTALKLALCGAAAVFAPAYGAGQSAPAPAAPLPGADFYYYANADWLNRTEVPAGRGSWSLAESIGAEVDARIVRLIGEVAASKKASGEARKVADFYGAYMDQAAIEAKGSAPLKPLLAKIDAIEDKAQLARALGASLRADVDPLNKGEFFTQNLFGLWVGQGLNDATRNMPYLVQGGLGMPYRPYYLGQEARMADMRARYRHNIGVMLTLAGYPDADARAARVLELETRIAQTYAGDAESGDANKANNSWTLKDFNARAPGMDWAAFFDSAGLGGAREFIVWHPAAMTTAAALVESTDVAIWKDYLAYHLVNHFAGTLPAAFENQRFAFSGKILSRRQEPAPRRDDALNATARALGDPLGRLYVERYFPAENKERVQKIARDITAAFGKRIDQLAWMAPATRAHAREKLKNMVVVVGYPDRWRSYEGLKVVPGDALGNAVRAEQFHYGQQISLLKQAGDPRALPMQVRQANPFVALQNVLHFPAAFLQPPYFDPKASDAHNYGAIGSAIGHEISHGYMDEGAQFDARGRLSSWWTGEDKARFNIAADKLAAQFSAYKPFPDMAINGRQTLIENVGDLAGVSVAYDAYQATLAGKPAPDGADREFFLGYARLVPAIVGDAVARKRLLSDAFAPSEYRAATVRNLDQWYNAFDVKPGQFLYLAPAARVKVF
ncbi:M13 family metallopeptidase [Massilia aquatica]|uniref:M13 family metallopeptidase n=1 Tax=Massilia aquatica TaxID=2609000 RepID=A0ABX0M1Y1_9BURK|nr:M13 family metallopeptidase [Massilia aquatica]NHZ41159.1 M13 family metallopeptidase [Massilia aquatica]